MADTEKQKWEDLTTRMQNEWRNASLSLWAALLTINGLVIAVFPVLATENPRHEHIRILATLSLMGLALLSSVLLIGRIRELRGLVFKTLKLANEQYKGKEHSSDELVGFWAEHIKFFNETKSHENFILILLSAEAALVVFLYVLSVIPC